MLHSSTVGAGFIPALPTSDENLGSYHAAARMGINPTPAAAECCKLSLFMSYWFFVLPASFYTVLFGFSMHLLLYYCVPYWFMIYSLRRQLFSWFYCSDSSLRNEGCFFLVPVCRSSLRSKPAPERNIGYALESRNGFSWFLLELVIPFSFVADQDLFRSSYLYKSV